MEINTDNDGSEEISQIAAKSQNGAIRGPHKRNDRSKTAVGMVVSTVWATVLKSASTAEFVTLFATATTPPQNQRKIGQFCGTQHQRKIPSKHSVMKGFPGFATILKNGNKRVANVSYLRLKAPKKLQNLLLFSAWHINNPLI